MPDIEALKSLLPQIEAATDHLPRQVGLELLVALGVCDSTTHAVMWLEDRKPPWTDLTSAAALCRKVLPDHERRSGYAKVCCWCDVLEIHGIYARRHRGRHPTNECLAILAALIKAVIAQHKQEKGDA